MREEPWGDWSQSAHSSFILQQEHNSFNFILLFLWHSCFTHHVQRNQHWNTSSLFISCLFVESTACASSPLAPSPSLPPTPSLSHSPHLDISVKNAPLVEVGKACNNLENRKLGKSLAVTSQNLSSRRREGEVGQAQNITLHLGHNH